MAAKQSHSTLEAVDAARWRIAIGLTVAMMFVYFGFILLVAFRKDLLATVVMPGLSLGVLFGALVILAAWGLTWVYVHWANRHYDGSIAGLRPRIEASGPSVAHTPSGTSGQKP